MPATDAVTIIKKFTWKGNAEEWSNTYHLDGTTPTTDAEWKTLADAIIASEKQCYHATHVVVRAYGYESDTPEHAAWTYDYEAAAATVAGTLTISGSPRWAGDQAGWVRVKRVTLSAKGKPVYLRKYFHGGASNSDTDPDSVTAATKTGYTTHAGKMLDGTLPGGMVWVTPNGVNATSPAASQYVTTRTLKRRGRRPTPAPPEG
jgi:hypothetical protein